MQHQHNGFLIHWRMEQHLRQEEWCSGAAPKYTYVKHPCCRYFDVKQAPQTPPPPPHQHQHQHARFTRVYYKRPRLGQKQKYAQDVHAQIKGASKTHAKDARRRHTPKTHVKDTRERFDTRERLDTRERPWAVRWAGGPVPSPSTRGGPAPTLGGPCAGGPSGKARGPSPTAVAPTCSWGRR